jgi:Tfp pilus assembly protein PilF
MRGRWAGLLLLVLTASAGRVQAAPVRPTHDRRVDELVGQARQWLSTRTIEARRMAIRDLEDAIAIAPDRGDALLLLARAYEQAGFQRLAQQTWIRASTLAPDDATARAGLALAWRRDYLKYLERASLDRAVEQYRAATRLDSSDVQSWLALSCLAIERGDLTEALAAAQGAGRTGRSRAEASLAAASACWRLGQVEAADSLFRDGIGHVRRSVRERYDDLAPLASERDTMVFNALDADESGDVPVAASGTSTTPISRRRRTRRDSSTGRV